jgi:hypothetical protein
MIFWHITKPVWSIWLNTRSNLCKQHLGGCPRIETYCGKADFGSFFRLNSLNTAKYAATDISRLKFIKGLFVNNRVKLKSHAPILALNHQKAFLGQSINHIAFFYCKHSIPGQPVAAVFREIFTTTIKNLLEVIKMKHRQSLKLYIFAIILCGAAGFSEIAFSTVVDFETTPFISSAPKSFGRAGPAQTIEIDDNLTFNGGVVLGLPTFLPTTPFATSPNYYATANHPSGGVVGDPSLNASISIDIAPSFGATTIEGLLLNGLNRSGIYTIEAFSNGELVDSASLDNLTANLSSGFDVFRLDSNGQPITSVLFSPDLINGEWNYFIDTIAINESILTAVPIPAGIWLFVTGIAGLFGFSKRTMT